MINALLREHFVCLAVDNVDNKNMTLWEWEWLRERGGEASTHGMSVFTADGALLARFGGYDPLHVVAELREALEEFAALGTTDGVRAARIADPPDSPEDMLRPPPEGASVLFASWQVADHYGAPQSSATTGNGTHDASFHKAAGHDRLWLLEEERTTLAAGVFPASFARRIARFHLDYALTGRYPEADIVIGEADERGERTVRGRFVCDDGSGRTAVVHGRLVVRDMELTGLDLLVEGRGQRISDCGFAACLTVVPEGREVRVALLFSLADPDHPLAAVTPHRARSHDYLATE